jgi:transposase-like protein
MGNEHITQEQRAAIGEAVRRLGVSEVARRLGLANESVLRVVADAGSQAGTEALAVARLDRLVAT